MGRQIIPARFWGDPVETVADLPAGCAPLFQVRLVQDAGSGLPAEYYWDGSLWRPMPGGGSGSLPFPTEEGEILYAVTVAEFVPARPLVNDDGLIQFSDDGRMVVSG